MIKKYHGIRPTPRTYLLLIMISFYLSLDIIIYHRLSSYGLELFTVFIGFLFSMYLLIDLSSRFLDKIVVKRSFQNPLVENNDVHVVLDIYNDSLMIFPRIYFNDLYPEMFELSGEPPYSTTILLPKTRYRYRYTIKPVLGRHEYKGLEIIVSDPFKLFNYKALLEPDAKEINVKPKPFKIPREIVSVWISRGLGMGKTRVRGYGQEFYSLREYYPGDDYRFIDWKSYARLRKLYVKEFEREANLSLVFIVDATRSSMRSMVGYTPLEYMARIVAGLSKILIRRGDWIALTIRTPDNVIRSGYGRGVNHYYRILDTLSLIRWISKEADKNLGEIVLEEAGRIPRRSKTLFFILTSYIGRDEVSSLIKTYEKLRSAGHIIYIIHLVPGLFEKQFLKDLEAAVYYGITYDELIENRTVRKELTRHGIYVVSTGPQELFKSIYLLIESYRMVVI